MSTSKRLHISGLNPAQCSVQDLHSRFQSFQLQVEQVFNWPPGKDGVGREQNWCFLTVEGEASKIKRATEVLNGTIWKGSKLRIGKAKREDWKEAASRAEEAEKEEAKKAKKKAKRRAKGVESKTIDQPVSTQDVENGLWGWKKTPAGHLLRPLHMRPAHPLSKPTAGAAVTSDQAEKKRKRRGGVKKSMNRARRVTIDPSRYGAIHLSGLVLDDGTDGLPVGAEWACEETEDGDLRWTLKDSEGKVLKEELVEKRKAGEEQEQQLETSSVSESGDYSSMDEVAAAINNAPADSSSEAEEESVNEAEERELTMSTTGVRAEREVKPFRFPSHDLGEESDFSDGYQEVQHDQAERAPSWKDERSGHLDLLKSMFGETELATDVPQPAPVKPTEEDESEDEEEVEAETEPVQDVQPTKGSLQGAQRRTALLGASAASGEPRSFQSLVRFDPGSGGVDGEQEQKAHRMQEQSRDAGAATGAEEANQRLAEAEERNEVAPADRVEMSKLKDMFRPKEDASAFTLFGDMDLDLEEEDELDEEREAPASAPMPYLQMAAASTAPHPPQDADVPFFFPSFDGSDTRSWLAALQSDRTIPRFCKDKTEEEINEEWKERKGKLTQEYKRRHREALKKKKRKYTGSRAAGTSMPVRA